MATIHDVARAAHVSIATVSRVINGDPSVHPALRDVVEGVVKQIGYRPNAAARSLRLARTGTIGVVVSELLNPVYTAIVHGIEQVAAEHGISLFLCDARGAASVQAAHLQRLHERRVDGVIIYPIGTFHEHIAPLREDGIPVVIIGQRGPSDDQPEVVVDEYDASRDAFRLLLGLGHRRIGFVVRGYNSGRTPETATMSNRAAAYRAAHAEAGVPVDESLLLAAYGPGEARALTATLLARPDRPTALVAGIHHYVPEMLFGIQQAGLRVPADLSLITYGDSRWAEVHRPPLTVVRSDYAVFGRRAAELLFRVAAGTTDRATVHHRAELVVRGSCAPPRQVQSAALRPGEGRIHG